MDNTTAYINFYTLLFIIYINDLPPCIKHSKIALYADDTALYFAGKDIYSIEHALQDDLNQLNSWFIENELIVNCTKTKVMLFGGRQRPF